uniref:Uncharacterized protein n=1 Tax=Anguilla anguilla TaxID=7936 RepID=A0A0E9RGN6_ANGAN
MCKMHGAEVLRGGGTAIAPDILRVTLGGMDSLLLVDLLLSLSYAIL